MNAEQFLRYLGDTYTKGRQVRPIARRRYAAYVAAYRVKTFRQAYYFHLDAANHAAIAKGLDDRDKGVPMVTCPELLE